MDERKRNVDRRKAELEFLSGGKTVPEALLRRRIADRERSLIAQRKEKRAVVIEASRYWSEIQRPPVQTVGEDTKAKRALDGLHKITERLASRKLIAPTVPLQPGGILAGRYSFRWTPPYYADYSGTQESEGDVDVAASLNESSAQMTLNAVTKEKQPDVALNHHNHAVAWAEVGVYFRPLFGPALLTVRADMSYSFSWYFNSVQFGLATTSAWATLDILGFKGPNATSDTYASGGAQFWNKGNGNTLGFDYGSDQSAQASAHLIVDPSHYYLVYLSCTCDAQGDGWPGGLSAAALSLVVRSIFFEVELIPTIFE